MLWNGGQYAPLSSPFSQDESEAVNEDLSYEVLEIATMNI